MKTFFCSLCKEAVEIINEKPAHENTKVTLYCKSCDALSDLTYDDRLPTRLEGSD